MFPHVHRVDALNTDAQPGSLRVAQGDCDNETFANHFPCLEEEGVTNQIRREGKSRGGHDVRLIGRQCFGYRGITLQMINKWVFEKARVALLDPRLNRGGNAKFLSRRPERRACGGGAIRCGAPRPPLLRNQQTSALPQASTETSPRHMRTGPSPCWCSTCSSYRDAGTSHACAILFEAVQCPSHRFLHMGAHMRLGRCRGLVGEEQCGVVNWEPELRSSVKFVCPRWLYRSSPGGRSLPGHVLRAEGHDAEEESSRSQFKRRYELLSVPRANAGSCPSSFTMLC